MGSLLSRGWWCCSQCGSFCQRQQGQQLNGNRCVFCGLIKGQLSLFA